jgi:hypothetical protein
MSNVTTTDAVINVQAAITEGIKVMGITPADYDALSDTGKARVVAAGDTAIEEKGAKVVTVSKSKATKEAPMSDQAKTSALTSLIERSATASDAGESAAGAVEGYEATYAAMLGGFAEALAAGNTETDIRKALQADQKQSGTVHVGASQDACQTLTALAALHTLEGDLPEGYVYRAAAKNGSVGLLEGEISLTALVRAVRAPADTAVLKATGQGGLYGKAVVTSIIAAAASKEEAIAGLLKAKSAIAAALKEAAKSEAAPKDALKYLKSAAGPLGKVEEALDAGNIGDAEEVRTLIASLTAILSAAQKHAALAV